MSTKETDLYSICTLKALTKGKRSMALNCHIHGFPVASSTARASDKHLPLSINIFQISHCLLYAC